MQSEQLNIDLNSNKIDMELGFLTSKLKPKNILVVGVVNPENLIQMILNAGDNCLMTVIEQDKSLYEATKEIFEKYDIEPRLNFYTGSVDEILPWVEDCFDLILLSVAGDTDEYENNITPGAHICFKKTLSEDIEICCVEPVFIDNVTRYKVYKFM